MLILERNFDFRSLFWVYNKHIGIMVLLKDLSALYFHVTKKAKRQMDSIHPALMYFEDSTCVCVCEDHEYV